MATYKGTGITGRETSPSVYKSSGVSNARVGQTYINITSGYIYTCTKAGGPSKARWAYTTISPSYKGTGITGTSTTASVFKLSGAKKPVPAKGNTYLNTNTGHVYICDTPGDVNTAKWKYLFTVVIAKPNKGVGSVSAPARGDDGSHTVTSKWTVPKSLTDSKNGRRATGQSIVWKLSTKAMKGSKAKLKGSSTLTKTAGASTKQSSVNLNNFDGGKATYTRASFYPNTQLRLMGVTCTVTPTNAKGKGSVSVSGSVEFKTPRKPSIGDFSFDAETGTISVTITTDAGEDRQERYDTAYSYKVYGTRTRSYYAKVESSSTATSIPLSCDCADYQQMGDADYISFNVRARSRGYVGQSDVVQKTYYLAFPKRTTIYEKQISINSNSGRVVIPIKTNWAKEHPCRKVQLEVLANVSYAKASLIPADAAWVQPDGSVDDGECVALTCDVADLQADAGMHTWIRVRSWSLDETVLQRVSAAVEIKQMHVPASTATDDAAWILESSSGADGRSAQLLVGWARTDRPEDDATGTEVSWSTDPNAWLSTDEPDSYAFTRNDGEKTRGGYTYEGSATLYVRGLTEGALTYLRARRYLEADTTTYSGWSDYATVTPAVAPSDVVLTVPASLPTGTDLSVSWTFGGGGTQTRWQLLSGSKVVAEAYSSQGSYTIPYATVARYASSNAISLRVCVWTGGDGVTSDTMSVPITEPPTLSVTLASTVTAQPLSFGVTSDVMAQLVATLVADGSETDAPDGVDAQPAGDVAWSSVLMPAWTASGDDYVATVTLPDGVDLRDDASYTLSVTATDLSSELSSGTVTAQTTVAWARQAPVPDATCVTLTPADYEDDDGVHHQEVAIALAPKESTAKTASGAAVLIDDVAPSSTLAGLVAYGQTEQDGDPTQASPVALDGVTALTLCVSESRNLLDALTSGGRVNNGITWTYNTDGTVTASGTVIDTANSWCYYSTVPTVELPAGTYTASVSEGFGIRLTVDGTQIFNDNSTSTHTFSLASAGTVGMYAVAKRSTAYDNATTGLQIECGQTATAWQQYAAPTWTPIDLGGETLDRIPGVTVDEDEGEDTATAIADYVTLAADGTVTLTKCTARTTTAATEGVTGDVGADVLSTTGVIEDGATVLHALDEPTTTTLASVTMPSVSQGMYVSVAAYVAASGIDVTWMTAPTVSTDTYDIYRVTGDGAQLIGEGYPLATDTVDEWAPYGSGMDLRYRIACRTEDGDVAWADFDYALDGGSIRVDWSDGSVELPYNIAIADGYTKRVDVHDYLDGGTDAYYNAGATRKAKLSTDVIRLDEQAALALVRSLARHPGTAYVRTPDGSAYEADVQVTDMSTTGGIVAVALDATEVRLSPVHMLPAYNVEVG